MNITKNTIDELNAELVLNIVKDDYQDRLNNRLKELRQKITMPGFRPGKVPQGLIKKMYGKQVLLEEISSIINDSLDKYIKDEKIKIIGRPIPSEKKTDIDWDKDENFEFLYDIGIIPEFDINLSKRNKINYFKIKPDEKMIDQRINFFTGEYGKHVDIDKVEEETMIRADFVELDQEGKPLENGIKKESGVFLHDKLKDEELKKQLINKKKEDTIVFNLKKSFPDIIDASTMLGIDKKQLENNNSDFSMKIIGISKFEPAEVNQELFDNVYGKDKVKSLDEFKEKIIEDLSKELINESNYKFHIDAKEELLKKIKFELPEDFLKRFILFTTKDEKLTEEKLNKDFELYLEQFKWEIIKAKIIEDNKLNISDEEILNYAKILTRSQFMQYGMNYVPDEYIDQYANKMLENEDEKYRIVEKIYEDKVIAHVKETVKLNEKEISLEKYKELMGV